MAKTKIVLRNSKGKQVAKLSKDGHDVSKRRIQVDIIDKRQIALELRRSGLSFREIAQEMGIGVKTASEYVQAELLELRDKTQLDASLIRDVELERCDYMLSRIWNAVKRGEVDAVLTALKIQERRAKLLGLDAPTKSQIDATVAAITPDQVSKMGDSEIEKRLKSLLEAVKGSQTDIIDAEIS